MDCQGPPQTAPSAQEIGERFAQLYYGLLAVRPSALRQFYHEGSRLSQSWASNAAAPDQALRQMATPAHQGLAQTMEAIMASVGGQDPTNGAPVVVTAVESVQTVALPDESGLMVHITGFITFLHEREGKMRRLSHIVLLEPSPDSGDCLVIRSDIVHYLDPSDTMQPGQPGFALGSHGAVMMPQDFIPADAQMMQQRAVPPQPVASAAQQEQPRPASAADLIGPCPTVPAPAPPQLAPEADGAAAPSTAPAAAAAGAAKPPPAPECAAATATAGSPDPAVPAASGPAVADAATSGGASGGGAAATTQPATAAPSSAPVLPEAPKGAPPAVPGSTAAVAGGESKPGSSAAPPMAPGVAPSPSASSSAAPSVTAAASQPSAAAAAAPAGTPSASSPAATRGPVSWAAIAASTTSAPKAGGAPSPKQPASAWAKGYQGALARLPAPPGTTPSGGSSASGAAVSTAAAAASTPRTAPSAAPTASGASPSAGASASGAAAASSTPPPVHVKLWVNNIPTEATKWAECHKNPVQGPEVRDALNQCLREHAAGQVTGEVIDVDRKDDRKPFAFAELSDEATAKQLVLLSKKQKVFLRGEKLILDLSNYNSAPVHSLYAGGPPQGGGRPGSHWQADRSGGSGADRDRREGGCDSKGRGGKDKDRDSGGKGDSGWRGGRKGKGDGKGHRGDKGDDNWRGHR